MKLEQLVAEHYTEGSPTEAVYRALTQAGADMDHLTSADLAPFEDLHMGGRAATADLAQHLNLRAGMRVLDVGSGIGGSARFFAQQHGCKVDGIDLTPEYVALANDLTARVGLSEQASFQQGSAVNLPFAGGIFNRAYMIHVGMNIPQKRNVFSQVYRVLEPAGLFGLYDAMRLTGEPFSFPMPWAASEESSFVETAAAYRSALEDQGFEIVSERDLWSLGIAGSSGGSKAPVGPHIFMGETAPLKMANIFSASQRRILAPIQLIARKT